MIFQTQTGLLQCILLCSGMGLCAGCRCDSLPTERTQQSTAAAPTDAAATDPRLNDPTANPETAASMPGLAKTLLDWKESAYGTTLLLDGPAVLLLTQTAIIHIPEGAPAQKMSVPLGPGPALMGDSIIYWHDGAVRAVSKQGSEPRTLGRLDRQPQRFIATQHGFVWLEGSPGGPFSLATFRGKTPQVLYRTEQPIVAATMLADWVFFVEVVAGTTWRIGGVSMAGKTAAFSDTHTGRPPSMLASAEDGIYFYDGPTRSVRRLSPDLEQEAVLTKDVICSPLSVSTRVACARVGGIFEIPGTGGAPRVLVSESKGATAAIAVDEQRLVWVVDTAENQLAVRSLVLPPL